MFFITCMTDAIFCVYNIPLVSSALCVFPLCTIVLCAICVFYVCNRTWTIKRNCQFKTIHHKLMLLTSFWYNLLLKIGILTMSTQRIFWSSIFFSRVQLAIIMWYSQCIIIETLHMSLILDQHHPQHWFSEQAQSGTTVYLGSFDLRRYHLRLFVSVLGICRLSPAPRWLHLWRHVV